MDGIGDECIYFGAGIDVIKKRLINKKSKTSSLIILKLKFNYLELETWNRV